MTAAGITLIISGIVDIMAGLIELKKKK